MGCVQYIYIYIYTSFDFTVKKSNVLAKALLHFFGTRLLEAAGVGALTKSELC